MDATSTATSRPGPWEQSATARSLRRAQLLMERRRAVAARRRRGYALRRPDTMPIVVRDRLTARLG